MGWVSINALSTLVIKYYSDVDYSSRMLKCKMVHHKYKYLLLQ